MPRGCNRKTAGILNLESYPRRVLNYSIKNGDSVLEIMTVS